MRVVVFALTVCLGLLTSSCAYVQTHKNVAEVGSYFDGKMLDVQTLSLHQQGERWYLSAHKAKFKLSYPTIHDSVFRRNDFMPEFKLIGKESEGRVYHAISGHAAQILQRKDGYYQLRALAEEMQRTPGEWVESLPGAIRRPIAAEIDGKQVFYMAEQRVPKNKKLLSKALSQLDFVIVDIPATIAYNVAIPFMAPFVFFYEFSQNE